MILRGTSLRYLLAIPAISLWLGGCASSVPKNLRHAPVDNPRLEQVRSSPELFARRSARWGGEIIEVRNAKEHSDLFILARTLDDDGEPQTGSVAQGRFIARVSGFVDPADFLAGQRVTVVGRIDGELTASVGDYAYRYPIVAVSDWFRWPPPRPLAHRPWWYDDPFYYGPFHDPWWPHRYGWPYYRRPYW